MLMRFDPFRDLDRLTQQLWNTGGSGSRPPGHAHGRLPAGRPLRRPLRPAGRRPRPHRAHRREERADREAPSARWDRQEGDEPVASERLQGTFTRQLFLGETLDADHVEARYEHGVLTLTIPVAEAAKPRKVAISASPAPTPSRPTPLTPADPQSGLARSLPRACRAGSRQTWEMVGLLLVVLGVICVMGLGGGCSPDLLGW